MRVVFAGTPEPAVVALQRLLDSHHEVVAVLTRPDARKGRGRSLQPSPVAELAAEHGIEVLKPSSLKPDSEDGTVFRTRIKELAPDCIPVVAYGNLVTPDLLDVAPHGWVNLHFSLLPQWRGAAPVQAAIRAGDDITGASTFRIEEGLDTGPVLGSVTEEIRPTDTAADLLARLAHSGAELLVATMDGLENRTLIAAPQQGDPSYAPKISKEDARVDWTAPALAVNRHIRAVTPAPGAWSELAGQRFKIGPVSLTDEAPSNLQPGELLVHKNDVWVGTATVPVRLNEIQPPGKKMMRSGDWARGAHLSESKRFDCES